MARALPKHHETDRYDWDAVISCIRAQEQKSESPPHPVHGPGVVKADAKYHAYVKVQKFLRKNKNCSLLSPEQQNRLRDAAIGIAKEYNLSLSAAVRLIISLSGIAVVHSIGKVWESQPSLLKVGSKLQGIEQSVRRITDFWNPDDRARAVAADFLIGSVARWASNQNAEQLRDFGLHRELFRVEPSGVEIVDHGERGLVRRWFKLAPIILRCIQQAQKDIDNIMDAQVGASDGLTVPAEPEGHVTVAKNSAQQRLVGSQLPRLYERTTGKRFGLSKSKEGDRILDITGVKFVRMALRAMGLRELSPEAIASHRKGQKRTRRSG